MDFLKTISIAASGLKAESGRMRVIAENIAAQAPGGGPCRGASSPSDGARAA